jgi:hypothetical protein
VIVTGPENIFKTKFRLIKGPFKTGFTVHMTHPHNSAHHSTAFRLREAVKHQNQNFSNTKSAHMNIHPDPLYKQESVSD